ncbi:unnamed protein product [Sphagnum balticum]
MASSDRHPCGVPAPSTPEDVPGAPKTVTSHILEQSAGLIQSLTPIKQFNQARLNEDVLQCLVYDSDETDARLIGDSTAIGTTSINDVSTRASTGSNSEEMIKKRDAKYGISTSDSRGAGLTLRDQLFCTHADYWKHTGNGWAVDLKEVEFKANGSQP